MITAFSWQSISLSVSDSEFILFLYVSRLQCVYANFCVAEFSRGRKCWFQRLLSVQFSSTVNFTTLFFLTGEMPTMLYTYTSSLNLENEFLFTVFCVRYSQSDNQTRQLFPLSILWPVPAPGTFNLNFTAEFRTKIKPRLDVQYATDFPVQSDITYTKFWFCPIHTEIVAGA